VTKLLSSWDLLEDDIDELAEHFALISYRSVKKGALDDLWQKRKVLHPRNLLQAILSDESIKILRRALRKTTGVLLSPEDVIAGVRRLLNESALSELEDIRISLPEGRRRRRKSSGETPKRRDIRVSLSQVIEAGILTAPLPLFRKYKAHELHATLQPDGAVEFQRTRYDNSSKAAEAARQTITGKKMNTNGWTFWRYRTPSGDKRSLADARSDFVAQRREPTA